MAIEGQRTMSKTQHYRKVTKPLLERKRRARMNQYLDELKELIVETMESNGEHVTKLEKADILELTVEYLKSKKEQQQQHQNQIISTSESGTESGSRNDLNVEKFRAGYTQAAYEVSKVFASIPGINTKFGSRLMKHLAYQLKDIRTTTSIDHRIIDKDNYATSSIQSPQKIEHDKNFHPSHDYHHNYHHHHHQQFDQQQLHKNENLPTGNEVWRPW